MIDKKDCCGCTACLHICPVKCIEMKEDSEGFLYPCVDGEKCIRCHKCEEVCPVQNITNPNTEIKTFVGYSKNEDIRKQSSSGGIFSLAAEWIIKQNGVVFGAAFDVDFEICHISAETEEELLKLRGSKYVQSKLGNTYPLVKRYLENNRKVLFTGTACQIAGLKKYLSKDYQNLYTVDVLCHGVPSPKVFKMYLDYQKEEYESEIKKIEFRNKSSGWKNFSVNIDFLDNKQYCVKFYEDKFMRMFLDNIDLRPSCYNCRFKDFPRIADVTIGDSWGIENYMPDMDDDRGTSVIIVNSAKGRKMIDEVKESINLKEGMLDKALPITADSRKSVKMHHNREKFFTGLEKDEDFDTLHGYLKKSFFQRWVSFAKYALRKYVLNQ